MCLLEQHRLAEGHIMSEQPNMDVIATMVTKKPTLVVEQHALYESCRSACEIHRE